MLKDLQQEGLVSIPPLVKEELQLRRENGESWIRRRGMVSIRKKERRLIQFFRLLVLV
jgi:hypothetical protein